MKLVKDMTLQEIFDVASIHLLNQGERSIEKEMLHRYQESCAYRGMDGLQCAVGALIPDELYDENMEGQNAQEGIMLPAYGYAYDETPDQSKLDLLDTLQDIHDAYCPSQWHKMLRGVALESNLSFDNVESNT
jgi:hypothetical protein